ncbi:hybrid sensor histidine kinase/response regulator [Bacterioplanoides pacificum]|uniref:histidine kinase n=1 Tax=Bacterioplanoides pacificum TaxID=1171596 RepID=A0ABV7VW34_9GAMM
MFSRHSFKQHPLRNEIELERHQLFNKEVSSRMVAGVITAILVGTFFVTTASLLSLLIWYCAIALASFSSWRILRRRQSSDARPTQGFILRWHILNLYMALLWGGLWALTPFLFFPHATDVQIFSLILLVILISSTPSVTMGCYPDIYIAFLTPVFFSFAWQLFSVYQEQSWLPIVVIPITYVSLVAFSLMIHQTQMNFIVLRLEHNRDKEKAERATREKHHFLATASHDIRQPLQAAYLYSQALDPQQMSDHNRDISQRLSQSLASASDLLSRLLDMSKLETRSVGAQLQCQSLTPVLHKLCERYRPQAEQQGLALTLYTEPGLAARFDSVLLEQALTNLISNALRYTQQGEISVSARRQSQQLLIEIRDTGIGIAAQDQEIIFDEFVQLNNPGRNAEKGFGLGLSIVNQACKLQHIGLSLDSEQGHGSCFTLQLEACDPAAVVAAETAEITTVSQETSSKPPQVLIVEDNETVLESLNLTLVGWDCDVWCATNLEQLQQQLAQPGCRPDVLISDDLLANGESSDQVIRRVSDHLGQPPATIILTGNTQPERMQQLNGQQALLLHKPVDRQQLQQALQQLTGYCATSPA